MRPEEAIGILQNTNFTNFNENAMRIFRYQSEKNPVYRQFLSLTGQFQVPDLNSIPFLPVSLFKTNQVLVEGRSPALRFFSSSTGGQGPSVHLVAEPELYSHSYLHSFRLFYGDPSEWCIVCLLPSYMEREGSSLLYMAEDLVKRSGDTDSGFFLYDHQVLHALLHKKTDEGRKTMVLGVSFALLDFAEKYSLPPNNLVFMETGGMKGRKKEMIRGELHALLCERLGAKNIHSEYGMTELLSQAWSKGGGRFECPPWMRVFVRDQSDPFSQNETGKRGRICVMDLANTYSCSFIETEDLGIVHEDGSFEVLGRIDNSDIRGCNVMVAF